MSLKLKEYSFDGSSLTPDGRKELIDVLDRWAFTSCIFVDIEAGIYAGYFAEDFDISQIPVPAGTAVKLLR